MIVAVVSALAAAATGLLVVRSTPPLVRVAAWCVLLAFAAAALAPDGARFEESSPRVADAVLANADVVNAALDAAAAAGPRSQDLRLRWHPAARAADATGPLGALAVVPEEPLPFDAGRLVVRAATPLVAGRPALLSVELPGLPTGTAAEVVVRAAAGETAQRTITIGGDRAAECEIVPNAPGRHSIEVAFSFGGHRVVARGVCDVGDERPLLVLDPSGIAAAALRAQGVAVRESADLPADWRDAPVIVLGRPLPVSAQQALVAAVIDGTGLFVAGPAFGGSDEPMRALLPVRPSREQERPGRESAGGGAADTPPPVPPAEPPAPPPERPPTGETGAADRIGAEPIEVDKRAIAMVLVVDRSGSMGNEVASGRTKMSYAKTSALRTALALGPGDSVAIVTFGDKGRGRVELPLTDATDLARVRAGIDKLAHTPERTFLLGGLRAAEDLLRESRAAVKHVVVVTDGEFDVDESLPLQELARHMRERTKATVSVISIIDPFTGQSFKREAEVLTRIGGGQFLPIDDPAVVPVFVSAEVTRALERVGRHPREGETHEAEPAPQPPIDPRPTPEEAPKPAGRLPVRAVAASPLLAPLPDPEPWPPLAAAVAGEARLDASVLLVAGPAGWPLLAFGNRGLGRVAAVATDLFGAAAAEFRRDPAFPARLSKWVAAVRPPQPTWAPMRIATEVVVEPQAPDARDAAWLRGLAGSQPAVGPAPPAPQFVRRAVPTAPAFAGWLLLAVVALAACERFVLTRRFRRGAA
ncbi:MAG: VWA domain-containing protein [Planctomycetes bacterium]|nr:VWA domain-containing protein [Planctomycetota bacterium]